MNQDTGKAYADATEVDRAAKRGERLMPIPEPVARAIISIRHEKARQKRARRRRAGR